jgi:alpha-galactosidase
MKRNRIQSVFIFNALIIISFMGVSLQSTEMEESANIKESVFSFLAPDPLAKVMRNILPFEVRYMEKALEFDQIGPGRYRSVSDHLLADVQFEYYENLQSLSWTIHLHNQDSRPLQNISVKPLVLKFGVDPDKLLPRVRHITGSFHYDACYPPRAYRVHEEAFLTHDHAKPVHIFGKRNSSYDHIPILQFAVGSNGEMAGFFVGFEWSGPWDLEAGWERPHSWQGEPLCDFMVHGDMILGDLTIPPGETLVIPPVHMGFFQGKGWTVLDNVLRHYIYARLSGKSQGLVPLPPVSYDHWFGIHGDFDVEEMKNQARRAAEIGCEYFCLDAGWYGKGVFGASGEGEWDKPDPVKFPEGIKSMRELSDLVRKLGMRFGIWHQIESLNGAREEAGLSSDVFGIRRLKLDTLAGRTFALNILRKWIQTYNISWMRWEFAGTFPDLSYVEGLYDVMDILQKEFPDLMIEGCSGGGQFFDLGMSKRTHITWLSDHTANPDVCRFMQTGALRFWPPHFLNMAVRAHKNTGDKEAYPHNILSRMAGALSFNGDIAQWSKEATALVRKHVDVYKSIRHLMVQPVFFPLDQPRDINDWDAVVYGDGNGKGQLLYVFRMKGPEKISIKIPGGMGKWTKLLGSETARIEKINDGYEVLLDEDSSVLWKR